MDVFTPAIAQRFNTECVCATCPQHGDEATTKALYAEERAGVLHLAAVADAGYFQEDETEAPDTWEPERPTPFTNADLDWVEYGTGMSA